METSDQFHVPEYFISRERGWVGPGASLDVVQKFKLLILQKSNWSQ